jgi:hypothetical protein
MVRQKNLQDGPENADTLIGVGAGTAPITGRMGDEGIEHPPLALSKTPILETPSAKSGAPNAESIPLDRDLALIQDRWPKLPEHIKQAVLALVQANE